MSYYEGPYQKRLNRYGNDYQTRVQKQRERFFDNLLLKSIYRVDFVYEDQMVEGILERYKQDETETLQYLLTRVDLNIPAGTVLMIPDKDMNEKPWMIYWLENIKASGYNRYVVLKMSHYITWLDREKNQREIWAYFYGQEDNMLKDELKSRSRSNTIYNENLKSSFFVTPVNEYIRKDDYFEVGEGALKQGYRVTGYDVVSTEGVEYVTVDPVYLRDKSPTPEPQDGESKEDYFWLQE